MNIGKITQKSHAISVMIFATLIFAFLGCGTGGDTKSPTPEPMEETAFSIRLSASSLKVDSDGKTSTTITVRALNDKNAELDGIKVTMESNTGIVSPMSVTTNTTNPATVTFDPTQNTMNETAENRTATITAISGSITAQIPIQVVGSTVTLEAAATEIPIDGTTKVKLTVVAKDSGNNLVKDASVKMSLNNTTGGKVNFENDAEGITGKTDNNGTFTTTMQGKTAGLVTLKAEALGASATSNITVTNPGGNFAIITPVAPTIAMKIGDELKFEVNAPNVGPVTFAASIGTWKENGKSSYPAPVATGKATATLQTTFSGVSNIAVYDTLNSKDARIVAMSSNKAPAKIILAAEPQNVQVSSGSTTGSSTLTATVYDIDNKPIGGRQVVFSIQNPKGSETVSPVIGTSASDTSGGLSLGQVRTTFTAGSTPSGADGIQIRSSVVPLADEGPPIIETNAESDAKIIIGGVAGSIAFAQGTKIATIGDGANYSWPMTVTVADSGGGAIEGAEVSLSVWPIAWSTGNACTFDPDDGISKGTFFNEDINENMFLDPGEDGYRKYFYTNTDITPGTTNGSLQPASAASGTVPSNVITDADGLGAFKLIYPKQSAIWTVVRLSATTKVLGSETRAELILRLQALEDDVSPKCLLGSSPYIF